MPAWKFLKFAIGSGSLFLMQSHVSLNSVFPYYNNMTSGALDEVILPTLAENRASDHYFDVSVLVEMQGIFSLSNVGCVGQQFRQIITSRKKFSRGFSCFCLWKGIPIRKVSFLLRISKELSNTGMLHFRCLLLQRRGPALGGNGFSIEKFFD